MSYTIFELVEEIEKQASTEGELEEICRIIAEAKGRLRFKDGRRGFWEGKAACWEMLACPPAIRTKCPAVVYRSVPCWEIEGTYNKLAGNGVKGDDIQVCGNCRVYRKWGHGGEIRTKLVGKGINVGSFIAEFSSKDGQVRRGARLSLVAIGKHAVPALVEALTDPNQLVRWEAAKSLVGIRDPAAADALVGSLEDEAFDVRWLAARALIALRREALVPLLKTIVKRADSTWLRQGAHHVLHDMDTGGVTTAVEPVLAALERADAVLVAPLTASAALDALAAIERESSHPCLQQGGEERSCSPGFSPQLL